MQRTHEAKRSEGVALLFVVLLTSVLFLVAMGISNVAYKELVFSLEARDSDLAFFAADTGLECGMYLYKKNPAPFDAGATVIFPTGVSVPVTCTGVNPLLLQGDGPGLSHFALPAGNQCAEVSVNRTVLVPDPATGLTPWIVSGVTQYYTVITSKGYNVSIAVPGAANCLPLTGALRTNLVSRILQATLAP